MLIKPHPPAAVLEKQCPVREPDRYNWEPLSLKYLAFFLNRTFGERVRVNLWHLMDRHDDEQFLQSIEQQKPAIAAFSDLDILVNEVNNLAGRIKTAFPDIWTVVGGKQSSLLKTGDRFPFRHIDFAIRGDGVAPMERIIRHRLAGTVPADIPGLVQVSETGTVAGPDEVSPRREIDAIDGIALRTIAVENHRLPDYFERHQRYPSICRDEPKTASILIGSGCPYACSVCQSPVEYGTTSSRVMLRSPESVAREIAWLNEHHGVDSIFSLESNLNLNNLRSVYDRLEMHGIHSLSFSGFVRAADVVKAHEEGTLAYLASKGLRVLSIGLDVPQGTGEDIYHKSFSLQEQSACLTICEDAGIVVLATAIASPDVDREVFAEQLELLADLPAAEIDIRLAIALRNTPYFKAMEAHLLHHPDRSELYYDRQNYRYQTIQLPGKITPDETYDLLRRFHEVYLVRRQHREYVLRMIQTHPDTAPFFQRQYRKRELELPAEIREAVCRATSSDQGARR